MKYTSGKYGPHVIHNGVYQTIYYKFKDQIKLMGGRVDEFQTWNPSAVIIGNVFEAAAARWTFQGLWKPALMLSETCTWDAENWQRGPGDACTILSSMRLWKPQETSPAERTEAIQTTTTVLPPPTKFLKQPSERWMRRKICGSAMGLMEQLQERVVQEAASQQQAKGHHRNL